MANADLLSALGFFTRRNFLDPDTCRRLREAVQAAPTSLARVLDDERGDILDRSSRSTERASVATEAVELIEGRLKAVLPEVERQYSLPLTGLQSLQFLVYRQGDFFSAHSDGDDSDDAADFVRARRVAAIVFLNGESGTENSNGYQGGALTFYGLFEQPEAKTLGLPLEAEEGLLVTFPSDVVHEVLPVTAGERYTAVTWFVS